MTRRAATGTSGRAPALPPRWFIRSAWRVHRGILRVTGRRAGLWPPSGRRGWGALELTTTGRRSGRPRAVVLGYLEDGTDLVTLAMNGWGPGEPAWWLNLQAHPEATVRLPHRAGVAVHGREAVGPERDRLWTRWRSVDKHLDEYAALRHGPTAVVVLSPATASR